VCGVLLKGSKTLVEAAPDIYGHSTKNVLALMHYTRIASTSDMDI
jgi:hypothetical protein